MTPDQDHRQEFGPPLWSIGLVIAFMLIVPLVLYSIGPPGPIRDGDTIFAESAVKVPLVHPLLYEGRNFDRTCLLDPHDPLMVIQRPSDRSDGSILAKVQGKTTIEWPFCPPLAEILLMPHQIVQKSDVLADAGRNLMGWWRR